jgi:sulfhydrogenase subunit beta (sulfur reductase)
MVEDYKKFISHEDLASWLDQLAREKTLIAPCEVSGAILYKVVTSNQQIAWEFTRPLMSVKEAFFPHTDRLLTIEKTGQEIRLTETLPEEEQVIFGVRSCDGRGLLALDAMFIDQEPADPYYVRRRRNTTLVGLVCQSMGSTCFCTSLGGSLNDPSGMDVMMSRTDGGYLIRAITEKGLRLLARTPYLEEATGALLQSRDHSPDYLQPVIYDLKSVEWSEHFDEDFWEGMAERCLSCRICAYVCPTCRCFTIRDETLPKLANSRMYERVRCWDSCASTAYRRVAGGHNPRPAKVERLRNRFLCKFYYYPQQYDMEMRTACTGCGRCIELCPVNIDIAEVLRHLMEVRG